MDKQKAAAVRPPASKSGKLEYASLEGEALATDGSYPALSVRDLCCGYGAVEVLHKVNFDLKAKQSIVLVGPNGVGKTTFFKTILGFLPRLGGELYLGGQETAGWSRRSLAQKIAYVPQTHEPSFSFTVRDMVLMGRTPSLEPLSSPSATDEQIVMKVLERLRISHLAERDYTRLSGGERQLALVARALAQQPQILIMDEPCASLDLGNQITLLEQVRDLNETGLAVIITSHDPNHAFMLKSEVLCFGRDKQVSYGSAYEVLTRERLSELYGAQVGVQSVRSPFGDELRSCIPFLRRREVATEAKSRSASGAMDSSELSHSPQAALQGEDTTPSSTTTKHSDGQQ